jgi:hypothetical protein
MKELHACSSEETHNVGTGTIKRLIHPIWNIATSGACFGVAAQKIRLSRLMKDVVGAMRPS